MKKVLFDTSVLVAGLTRDHVHFKETLPWLEAVSNQKLSAWISTHCLAEVFNSLTRMPHEPAVNALFAKQVIQGWILKYCRSVALSQSDYLKMMERLAFFSLRGPIIYDALHLQAALKEKVSAIVTLNEKDFARLIKPGEIKIINPLNTSPH